ncbi:MAG: peptidoglycan DD-metalloendopeptidase family protein [bacterium]
MGYSSHISARPSKSRALLFFAAIALLLSFLSTPAPSASTNKNLTAKKEDLQKRLNQARSILKQSKHKERSISEAVRQIDAELTRTSRELDQKIRDLKRAQAQEIFYKNKLVEASNKFDAYRTKYKGRLVSYYKNGHAGYIEVLFNSSSFSDFVSRITYLRMITKNDLGILTELKTIREEVAQRRKQVESARMNIEVQSSMLAQEKEHTAAVKNEKNKALLDIRNDVELQERELAELEAESRRIEAEIQSMMKSGRGVKHKFTGTLGSPVCGRAFSVTSGYGYRKAPKRGASSNHRGIDIRASYGQEICAAADGIVLNARYRGGYGNTVIISHGSDITTLYGHALRLLVREGETVRKGQVIMLADSTGTSTGNHLHFEVRVNGVPVNPIR